MSLRKIMEKIVEQKPDAPAPQTPPDEAARLGPREGFEELFEDLTGEVPKAPTGKPADPAGPA